MYQGYLGCFHKTHLLNWARPTESQYRLYTHIWVTLLLIQNKKKKKQGLEVAMTGRGISIGSSAWVQVYRRRPSWAEGGTHVWEGEEEPAVIHGVLTWARAGRWRMRQAEPGGTGIVWVGVYCDHFFGSRWRSAIIPISRTGWRLWEAQPVDGQSHQPVTEGMPRARKGQVYQHVSLSGSVCSFCPRSGACFCAAALIPEESLEAESRQSAGSPDVHHHREGEPVALCTLGKPSAN